LFFIFSVNWYFLRSFSWLWSILINSNLIIIIINYSLEMIFLWNKEVNNIEFISSKYSCYIFHSQHGRTILLKTMFFFLWWSWKFPKQRSKSRNLKESMSLHVIFCLPNFKIHIRKPDMPRYKCFFRFCDMKTQNNKKLS
jgi:hypothetical protein